MVMKIIYVKYIKMLTVYGECCWKSSDAVDL